MMIFEIVMLVFLIICSISACLSKKLLTTVIIFMAYSLVMAVLWIRLESPDLALTEAAVGAGITSILMFVTLRKIGAIGAIDQADEKEAESQ